jgi:cobalamin biosynthesis protein CbiD
MTVPPRNPKGNRTGFTTGACAAAAAKAAARCLVRDTMLAEIETTLPNRIAPRCVSSSSAASASAHERSAA